MGWGWFFELSVLIRKENFIHLDVQFYLSLSSIFQRTLYFWENLDCITYLLLISGLLGRRPLYTETEGWVGSAKAGALAKTNSASWGVFFQTLKILGPSGTCQETSVPGRRLSLGLLLGSRCQQQELTCKARSEGGC